MNKLILYLFVIVFFTACKKSSSEPATPAPPTGNYIKIDNDSRQLGDVPSADISYVESAYPEGPVLSLATSTKAINIDDSKNEHLIVTVHLFEGEAPANEYLIQNVATPPPASAWVTVALSGNEINGGMSGQSGKLYITRDGSNNIKSFRFENVKMRGTYEATVSCNVVVK